MKTSVRHFLEDNDPVKYIPQELAKAGLNPKLDELKTMSPGLRERDYVQILFDVRRLSDPLNRRERRAKAAVGRRYERALTRAVDAQLEWADTTINNLTPAGKETYHTACKTKNPHPDGRFARDARDNGNVKLLKRTLFEADLLRRIVRRDQKRQLEMLGVKMRRGRPL